MWSTTRLRNLVHVWTYEEITRLGQFGSNMGWFYGFVRGDGKLMFGEIFPGYGVAVHWPYPWWSLRTWYRVVRDVLYYRPRDMSRGEEEHDGT